jgi:uncharacterized protein YecE (DUF72 family)
VIRVGPAGWSYADWEGRAWPRRKPRGFHPLAHLARFVDCVELNSSFYALPDPRHCARWVALLEPHPAFRLTAKLHSDLTHGDDVRDLEARCEAFLAALAPLVDSGRLAALLAQFPSGFRHGPSGLRRLERLASALGALPLVLEVRHGSWFGPEALAAVGRMGWSLAGIDLPPTPPGSRAWHPPADAPSVGPIGYLRLHGRNSASWFDPRAGRDDKYDYLYSEQEVAELVARARRLAGGRDETYVVTNNHFGGQALCNALELRAALRSERVPAPAELVEAFPRLRAVARVQGQQGLFG